MPADFQPCVRCAAPNITAQSTTPSHGRSDERRDQRGLHAPPGDLLADAGEHRDQQPPIALRRRLGREQLDDPFAVGDGLPPARRIRTTATA